MFENSRSAKKMLSSSGKEMKKIVKNLDKANIYGGLRDYEDDEDDDEDEESEANPVPNAEQELKNKSPLVSSSSLSSVSPSVPSVEKGNKALISSDKKPLKSVTDLSKSAKKSKISESKEELSAIDSLLKESDFVEAFSNGPLKLRDLISKFKSKFKANPEENKEAFRVLVRKLVRTEGSSEEDRLLFLKNEYMKK